MPSYLLDVIKRSKAFVCSVLENKTMAFADVFYTAFTLKDDFKKKTEHKYTIVDARR